MTMTLVEYGAVRADPANFAVLPGHEVVEIELVVEQHERYVIVQKNEDLIPDGASHAEPDRARGARRGDA
jgi:hypothetical protein